MARIIRLRVLAQAFSASVVDVVMAGTCRVTLKVAVPGHKPIVEPFVFDAK